MLVIGFLWIEANRAIVADSELTGAEAFETGNHGEVVCVAPDIRPGLPEPERRLDDRDNTGLGHCIIVVRRARYHVSVRIDDHARMRTSGRAIRSAVGLILPVSRQALNVGQQTRELL